MLSVFTGVLALVEPPVAMNRPTRTCVRMPAPIASANDDMSSFSRRQVLSTAAAAALTSASTLPAFAESTLVTRQQAYTRYVPRIERGRDFWAGGLRKYIQNGDWASIKQALEPVTKTKGGAIAKVFGPLKLWASSFSGKTVSDKTLAMNIAIDELAEAAASLEVAANGKVKSTGPFAFLGGDKTMEDSKRQQLAQAAYKKGVVAFNKYIEIGNDGLGLSFAPIDTIE